MKIEVDQYQNIRHLYIAQGLLKREISKRLQISRNTVTKYCKGNQVPWERRAYHREPTVVTPAVKEFIKNCLKQDQEAPKKQHHTAKRQSGPGFLLRCFKFRIMLQILTKISK